jgi:hypothetical protein
MRNKLIWHEFFVEWMLHSFPVIRRKQLAAALMVERNLFSGTPAKIPATEESMVLCRHRSSYLAMGFIKGFLLDPKKKICIIETCLWEIVQRQDYGL